MPANPLGLALRNRRAGHHTLVWARPDLQAPENFTLTSPAFDHGAPIPERHRGRLRGANISPALNWTQPPAGTVELVLIVQDPDVPFGKPATHALALGIDPSLNGVPENALTNPSPIPGIRHGKGTLGRRGWAGPMPPRSHGPAGRNIRNPLAPRTTWPAGAVTTVCRTAGGDGPVGWADGYPRQHDGYPAGTMDRSRCCRCRVL